MSQSKVALVWGANGVSGSAMMRELTKLPSEEWSSIIGVSRREMQCGEKDPRIKFVAVDVLNSPIDEIVMKLKEAGGDKVTHVSHYTYIEKQTEDEMVSVNTTLLEKALHATAAVSKNVKVFHLQTGYKVHLLCQPWRPLCL
jgi:nucleoside-diphosphate-sugar epimerase